MNNKSKITKYDHYWEDEDGNTSHFCHFGSEEKALRALQSLKDCFNCADCIDCEGCTRSSNCFGCKDCIDCADCVNCSSCMGSFGVVKGLRVVGIVQESVMNNKSKITRHSDYWEDENNNKSYFWYFGSEARALEALQSLENCVGCVDCRDCSNCEFCVRCTLCADCSNCDRCVGCIVCYDCAKEHMKGLIPRDKKLVSVLRNKIYNAFNEKEWTTVQRNPKVSKWYEQGAKVSFTFAFVTSLCSIPVDIYGTLSGLDLSTIIAKMIVTILVSLLLGVILSFIVIVDS